MQQEYCSSGGGDHDFARWEWFLGVRMQLALQSKFRQSSLIGGLSPLAVWALPSTEAAKNFSAEEIAAFEKLRKFEIPFLHLTSAFDARLVTCNTPQEMGADAKGADSAIVSALTLLRAADLAPFSYSYEASGQLAAHISPHRPESLDRKGYQKSIGGLRGHTDAAFNPSNVEYARGDKKFTQSPDFVTLLCQRNPNGIPTTIAVLDEVLDRLTPEDIAHLQREIFILTPQESFVLPSMSVRVGSVLWQEPTGKYCCRFSHRNVSVDADLHADAAVALEKFSRAVHDNMQEHALAPGDILIINNRLALHGRDEIRTNWQPTARWLMRIYANRGIPNQICLDPRRPWMVE